MSIIQCILYTMYTGDWSAKRQIETSNLKATLDGLEASTLYKISIQPVSKGVRGESVTVTFPTLPYAPQVAVTEYDHVKDINIKVVLDRMPLPEGMTNDALIVRYYKMDTEGNTPLFGTSRTRTIKSVSHVLVTI